MRKKYQKPQLKNPKYTAGAFDKRGHFWHVDDIRTFSHGVVLTAFGQEREAIEIVSVDKSEIK